MMATPEFDVVVVGGSIAGCTVARLYGRRGARVAVVERRPDVDAFKTVCTHYIQPSATPTIERLGLAGAIEARGAVRNWIDLVAVRRLDPSPAGHAARLQRHPPDAGPAAPTDGGRDPGRRVAGGVDGDRGARPRPAGRHRRRGHVPHAPRVGRAAGRGRRRPRLARRALDVYARARAPAQPVLLLGVLGAGC